MYEIIAGIIFAVVLSALVIEKRSKQDKNDDEKLSLSEIESKTETHNDESQTQEENHNAEEKTQREEQTNQTDESQRQLEAQSQTLKAQDGHKLGRKYQRAGDYGKAVYWYKKAAEQGHIQAQFMLGSMYYDGDGVRANLFEAVKWYHRAARQGHIQAQSILKTIFTSRRNAKRDKLKKAVAKIFS